MRLDHLLSMENRRKSKTPVRAKEESSYCLVLRLLWEQLEKGRHLKTWGCSSAGRAPALQAGGQEFDPPHLHQRDEGKDQPS